MKINFDYQIFDLQHYGGISRYYVRLFENILNLGEEIKIVSPIYINKYLQEINFYKNIHGFNVKKIPARLFPFFKMGNEYLGTKIALKLGGGVSIIPPVNVIPPVNSIVCFPLYYLAK